MSSVVFFATIFLLSTISTIQGENRKSEPNSHLLNTLRRQIERLRDSLGEAVVDVDDPPSSAFAYQIDDDKTTQTIPSFESPSSSISSNFATTEHRTERRRKPFEGILNIKAGIRTVPKKDHSASDGKEDFDIDKHQNVLHADAGFQHHLHRHRHKHRRRKDCTRNKHGRKQIMCPSKSRRNYDVCITVDQLCDGARQCPHGEDEHPTNCLFYKTTKEHMKQVYNTVMALADHIVKSEDDHLEL